MDAYLEPVRQTYNENSTGDRSMQPWIGRDALIRHRRQHLTDTVRGARDRNLAVAVSADFNFLNSTPRTCSFGIDEVFEIATSRLRAFSPSLLQGEGRFQLSALPVPPKLPGCPPSFLPPFFNLNTFLSLAHLIQFRAP